MHVAGQCSVDVNVTLGVQNKNDLFLLSPETELLPEKPTSSIQPSKSSSKPSLLRPPYIWLTAAAILELLLSSYLVFFFVMYLYDEIKYMTSSTRGIGPAFARPTLSEWLGRGWC